MTPFKSSEQTFKLVKLKLVLVLIKLLFTQAQNYFGCV